MALVGLRVSIVLRTLSKRKRTSRERRNSGNISLSPCSLYLYSCKLLFIAYILLVSLLLLSCHIVYSPSCISRQLTFLVEPKFVKKVIKIVSCLFNPPLVDIPILSIGIRASSLIKGFTSLRGWRQRGKTKTLR